jgi:hypothetical protein
MRKWLCKIFGHDWDMTFPFKDDPMRWKFVCTRCGAFTYTQPNL